MFDKSNPLLNRIKKDPKLKMYLNNDYINCQDASAHMFSQSFSEHAKFTGEVFTLYANDLHPELRRIVEMYLEKLPVRDIAVKMNTTSRAVTVKLNQLKSKLMKRYKEDRQNNLFSRNYATKLDTLPQYIATKAYTLRLHNQEKAVYLINRDNETFWVDENGVAFTKDIQEILNDLPELKDSMENIDVE